MTGCIISNIRIIVIHIRAGAAEAFAIAVAVIINAIPLPYAEYAAEGLVIIGPVENSVG